MKDSVFHGNAPFSIAVVKLYVEAAVIVHPPNCPSMVTLGVYDEDGGETQIMI